MNIAQLLVRSARVFPQNPALYYGSHLLFDYRTLAMRAACIAAYLRGPVGLSAGDRVAIYMANNPQYLETLYGIWWAGLVAVPINAKLHPQETLFVLENAQARTLFLGKEEEAGISPLLAQTPCVQSVFSVDSPDYLKMLSGTPLAPQAQRPDDLAWLFYTSGTTGRPKGVMQTHRMILAMTACYFTDVDPVSSRDAIVYAAPMSHGAGLYNFPNILKGARHVVPESGGFDPGELVALSQAHRDISLFAAPTMVKRLVNHLTHSGQDPSGFKTIVYGGGPMYAEDIKQALDTMGDRFVQIYGQGESPMAITALARAHLTNRAHPRWESRLASVGVAQSMVEVKVTDDVGAALPNGETGEVLVRGDIVMPGYWQNPAATQSALRDGWLWTGDLGALDQDGFLTLKDRSKDLIISGGSNIYPREIEEILLKHPAVAEVAIVGVANPDWGEDVIAFVVCRAGQAVSPAALDALCLANIARFKRPKQYRFITALPKNNYGKVLKTDLKASLETLPRGNDTKEVKS